jgi:hypothetical protein
LKEALRSVLSDVGTIAVVDEIPECEDPEGIAVCGIRKKRKASEYQIFIGQCLRDKHLKGFDPTALKDCAAQWRQLKKS